MTRRSWLCGLFSLAAGYLTTTACAVNPRLNLAEEPGVSGVEIVENVPFFAQKKYQCGPAALAGVLRYSGVDTEPDSLVSEVYVPKRKGSLQVEMLAATRRAGRIAYPLGGETRDILAQIEAGRPVLVLQNLGTKHIPLWHYAVVIGIDPEANEFVLNSGHKQHLRMSAGHFMRTWNWAGDWAMVALAPGTLPARPDPERYMQAVAAFEAVAGGDRARPSWQAAARTWPQASMPHLALGNLAYFEHDLKGAIPHYLDGLERAPDNPALLNNLASVLGELGCPRTARKILQPEFAKLESGSAWRKEMQATLSQLPAEPAKDSAACGRYLRPQ